MDQFLTKEIDRAAARYLTASITGALGKGLPEWTPPRDKRRAPRVVRELLAAEVVDHAPSGSYVVKPAAIQSIAPEAPELQKPRQWAELTNANRLFILQNASQFVFKLEGKIVEPYQTGTSFGLVVTTEAIEAEERRRREAEDQRRLYRENLDRLVGAVIGVDRPPIASTGSATLFSRSAVLDPENPNQWDSAIESRIERIRADIAAAQATLEALEATKAAGKRYPGGWYMVDVAARELCKDLSKKAE